MAADPRKDYLNACAAAALGVERLGLTGQEVDAFVDRPDCSVLQVLYDTGPSCANEIRPVTGSVREVHFLKSSPGALSLSDLTSQVVVGSLGRNSLAALLSSVRCVFGPVLSQGVADPRLQQLMSELEAGLASALRQGPQGSDSLDGIRTPGDEFQYWADLVGNYQAGETLQERGKAFSAHFSKVSKQWGDLEAARLSEVLELLDATVDMLDGVWKEAPTAGPPYPQPRMEHLMTIVAETLIRKVQSAFYGANLWTPEGGELVSQLKEALRVCEKWTELTQEYTERFWKAEKDRKWKGTAFKHDPLLRFSMRLEEILSLRSQHDELMKLLSPEERERLQVSKVFDPLRKIQALIVNQYTNSTWAEAKMHYEQLLQSFEQDLAAKLKGEIVRDLPPLQLLREFQKWQGLLRRKNLQRALQPEREHLLNQLIAQTGRLREEFEKQAGAQEAIPRLERLLQAQMSPLVTGIVWARGLQQKTQRIVLAAEELFEDLDGVRRLRELGEGFLGSLREYQQNQFKAWKTEVEAAVRNESDPLALEVTGKMMVLDLKDGLLKVSYSERLVQLLKEVRQLTEYGFKVSATIKKIVIQGKKYYKEAITLKQVANFYNNMGSQIIDSQKKMLLEAALAFEQVVKTAKGIESGSVTWQNPAQVEEYIQRVQKAASDLMTENRKLRKVHFSLVEQIADLQNVDLLRHRQMWKQRLDGIRKTLEEVTTGKDPEAAKMWKAALDKELAKSLEVQYRQGLEGLSENLPEIRADLAFSNKNLTFRPPFEELKTKYYREIKLFIGIPLMFTGLGGNADVYRKMPDSNAGGLITVYQKAEQLFSELREKEREFRPWVVLGSVDIEALVEENMKTVEDWEANFKVLRQKRKEAEKLPDSVKVHCFTLSLTPLKTAIDDQLQRFSESLVLTLKTTLKTDSEKMDEFLKNAQILLNRRPETAEELAQAQLDVVEVAGKRTELEVMMKNCSEKNKLLKQLTGAGLNTVALQDKWQQFQVSIEAYGEVIERQKEVIRKDIERKGEELHQAMQKFAARWEALKPKSMDQMDWSEANEAADKVRDWRQDWQSLRDRLAGLKQECTQFSVPPPAFSMQELEEDIAQQEAEWGLFEDFRVELDKLGKEDWLSFRGKLFSFQDLYLAWGEKVKGRTRESVGRFINDQIEMFKRAWPLLKLSTGEGFEKEHWKNLFYYLKLSKEVTVESLKFAHFLGNLNHLVAAGEQVKELQARAQGEVTIREAIQELRIWCDETKFSLYEHIQNERSTPLIKDWKELLTLLSDNQALLLSLKESRFFSRFADQIGQFEAKLSILDECLVRLSAIQRKWVYLDPIFGRGALPQEQGRFKRVDDEYRSIMLSIKADERVLSLANMVGLKDTLDMLQDQLDRCQKALNEFLEDKRARFPRFYFLGDDDLLEILGQARNPSVIQSHLKKLFAGIHKVDIQTNSIKAMLSSAGETVSLRSAVAVSDEVETWLGNLAREMQSTLSGELTQMLKVEDVTTLLSTKPSQICSLAEMVTFCAKCTKAIGSNGLAALKQQLDTKLAALTSLRAQSPLVLLKVKSLVLDLIHNLEVVTTLQQQRISNPTDWEWHRQLKFAIASDQLCQASMCDAQFKYTYEYQGNAPKLVHTPLTDKCYLTLTQGMMMGYGGNPYGPAGTGKTESVKALGQAMGRQVLVFNCDEGIDFKSMGRIFIGLVKCGAWGCFDEFNRLLEEQLSAISQQIQVIQWALKNGEKTLQLLGRTIDVNPNAGIFVTMNPAGKGYGGRSKLPDNLKMLFRPVAMSVPDNDLIAEVLLYAEGFRTAKVLATKIVSLFSLCKQLLSTQEHYDWGLRALKTTLTIGGQLVQTERAAGANIDSAREAVILIKAIRINTLPKLTYTDLKKFNPLLQDIFTGASIEDIEYEELEAAITTTIQELKLEYSQPQVAKMLQFHEATRQRMGVVLVGPSGCGKSTIWKVLKLAYEKLHKALVTHVMNPKSMPRQQLLGKMDHDTREWTDGVLTVAARNCVKQPSEVNCWIICDGDIDPEWIESLNSVLDDNHLLTLPTGERISFGDNVNFIFETNDLRFASPATVSRMGMIFMSEEDVDIDRLIASWLSKLSQDQQTKLAPLVNELLPAAISWALDHSAEMMVKTTKVGTVMSVLSVLGAAATKAEFVHCMVKGLGANFPLEQRQRLALELFARCKEQPPDARNPLNCYSKDGVLRQFVTEQEHFELKDLSDYFSPPLVRTVGIQRDIELFRQWLEQGDPFIVVGPEGCGKNLMLRAAFAMLKSTQVTSIHCNAQSSAVHVLQKLSQMCVQSTGTHGRVLRPKDTQRLILYLKDVNLPTPDKYNTIQLIAFLQQLVSYQGFYDENLEFVHLERISIVASMNPSSTVGRHQLSQRFTATVRVAVVDYPPREELMHIYEQYLKAILSLPALGNAVSMASRVSQAVVDLYLSVKKDFSVDEHRHYLFTPRDCTQLVCSLMRYEAQTQPVLGEVVAYEACRTFKDRLVSREHCVKFDSILKPLARQQLAFNEALDSLYTTWFATHQSPFKQVAALGKASAEDMKKVLAQGLLAYEREFRELPFFSFEESIMGLVRLNRALARPGGSVLLVGESGVGKRTSAQLVSHMLNMTLISTNITREYTEKEFRRDLKTVLQTAGIEGTATVLFLEDHQLLESTFLQLLNSLLSSGEVPGLYKPEEVEPLLASLGDEMKQEGGYRSLYEFFAARVRRNLRVVLSMDPRHPHYSLYCASNPALYNNTAVLWVQAWSKESMSLISSLELAEPLEKADNKTEIVELAINIHRSMNCCQRNFMDLLQTFKLTVSRKVSSQQGESSHLKAGLTKLREAETLVGALSKKAEQQQKLLAEKQREADEALKQITQAMEKAAERKQEVEQLQRQLQEENHKINTRKSEVEIELADIQPMIEAAKKSVGNIQPSHLSELKALRIPPEPVNDVLFAVLRMMGNSDTSWTSMKRFLGERSVITSILNFDPHVITPEIRADVEHYLSSHSMSFEKVVIERASLAAAPMAAWVKAILKYSIILEKIRPLEQELEKATRKMEASQKRLMDCEDQLEKLDKQVVSLRDNFSKRTSEAEALKVDLQQAEGTLNQAQTLLGKLGGEKQRWELQLKQMQESLTLLPKHCMLAAGFAVYLSQHDEETRKITLKQWRNFARTVEYDFRTFMSSESELLKWKTDGLPGDSLSMENGIIIFNSVKTPLVIDPSTLATNWLKRQEASQLEVINLQDAKFGTQLELGVRFGKTLLIQELDRIEPLLFPLLRKDLIHQGPRWCVQIGDKVIDYSESFKLYLSTRDSAFEIPPNAAAIISTVNFTVTKSGLEGQLLSVIIGHEQPELERKKSAALANQESQKLQLSQLEKKLLEELATSEGNILENKSLLQSLNSTKASSIEIKNLLDESKEQEASLDRQCDVYRPLAVLGSVIYNMLQDLRKANQMYQFALGGFMKLFQKVLSAPHQAESVERKLELLSDSLRKKVWEYVSRALFKADRLMFCLHFAHAVQGGMFESNEWEFFKGEFAAAGDAGHLFPNWAAADRRDDFGLFGATFPKVVSLCQLENEQMWRPWTQAKDCENRFPPSVAAKISPFQALLLVKILRPDRLEAAMNLFVLKSLKLSESAPPFSLSQLVQEESVPAEPILFIVSPGADPSKELEEFAESQIGRDKFLQMAMGGGQNDEALRLVREASHKGDWVCLKNLHLVTSWLPLLEKELKVGSPHASFRLFLTTEPHPKFPAILLQSSLKVSYESPPGVKKNLLRTYASWQSGFVDQGGPQRAQALFALAWFHAVLQERRTYIPQGWSKFYEFSYSDLKAGATLMETLGTGGAAQWVTLRGLLENAIYGGRVDNEFDIKVLRTYLGQLFSAETFTRRELWSGVTIPANGRFNDYMNLIQALPESDSPSLFGLPENIDRSVQRFNSARVIKQLKQLSAVSEEHLKFDRAEWSNKIGPLVGLWQTLHRPGETSSKALEREDPLENFLCAEAAMAGKLIEFVHKSLDSISKVLSGSGLLTSTIEEDAVALLLGNVPERWSDQWDGPSSPVPWLRALVRKAQSLKRLLERMVTGQLFAEGISLGDLFHPETFLNAFRQLTARRLKTPMETLKLVTSFDSRLAGAIQLRDLMLQGSEIATGQLTSASAESADLAQLPPLFVTWSQGSGEEEGVVIPVYMSLEREKLLCTVKLPSQGPAAEKVLSGTAVFLSGSE